MRLFSTPRLWRQPHRLCLRWQLNRNQHNKARIVLLPEVPSDTPQSNQFLRCVEDGSLPDFQSWTFRDSVNGTAKLALEYEGWLLDYLDRSDGSSFSAVMDPLESNGVPVDAAWYTCRQHYVGMFYGNGNAHSHIRGLDKMMLRISAIRFNSPSFHKVLKVLLSGAVSNPWQKRLLEKYLLECRLNGMDLSQRKRMELEDIRRKLELKKTEYWDHIRSSSVRLGDRIVESLAELPDAPEHVLRELSDNPEGPIRLPFTITYSPRKFSLYMKYGRNRQSRWAWWSSVNNRAAFNEDVAILNNSIIVEEIREHREREAKWLGYKTYTDSQLSMCMADSVDEVKQFLCQLGDHAADELDAVYERMCVMADSQGERSSKDPPNAWDLSYYARQVAKEKYNLDHQQLAHYFPFPQTMRNILHEMERLFGIEFQDVTERTARWHPSVLVYQVINPTAGTVIGHLFIDPYSRPGKLPVPLTMEGRPRSGICQSRPTSYLNLPLCPPTESKPSLLYMDQLSSLAFQLGKAVQQLVSGGSYSETVGDNLVEWDCKDVCANVVQLLVTGRRDSLTRISQHYQTGEKMDTQTATNYLRGGVMANLPELVREVVDSQLDLSMYSSRLFWRDVYAQLHDQYLPYKWHKSKGDEFVCSFGGYVTEKIASKYYTGLWTKMLAGNIVHQFEQAEKQGQQAEINVGRKFADVYLTKGGQYSQRETFRMFSGKDPTVEPILRYYVRYQ